jgi:hypothetical protein
MTHIKIVVVALIAGIAVVTIGLTGQIGDSNSMTAQIRADHSVVKAGKSSIYTSNDSSAVR